MKNYRTPHTFDMNDYYTGKTVVLGGRDFEREEKETPAVIKTTSDKSEKAKSMELDWSFLHKFPRPTVR